MGLRDDIHRLIEEEFRNSKHGGASFEQLTSAPQAFGTVAGVEDTPASRHALYLSLGVAKAVDLLARTIEEMAQKIEEGAAS